MKLVLIISILLISGCATMTPTASLTLLTDKVNSSQFHRIATEPVEDSECTYMVLIFFGGNLQPSHEAAIDRLLEKHQADALYNAELTISSFGIPYLYMQNCANVKGVPIRRTVAASTQTSPVESKEKKQ